MKIGWDYLEDEDEVMIEKENSPVTGEATGDV